MSPAAVLRAHYIDAIVEGLPRVILRHRRKLLVAALRRARVGGLAP